jgi:hypothetical protein
MRSVEAADLLRAAFGFLDGRFRPTAATGRRRKRTSKPAGAALQGDAATNHLQVRGFRFSVKVRIEERRTIESAVSEIALQGARYPDHLQQLVGV